VNALTATLDIINRLGLHARAASRVVALARRFESDIQLRHANNQADAKSIMSVLLLAAPQGARLEVELSGPDADAALLALRELFAERFGEPD
jgi:phosphocarrier protein HPr